MEYQNKRGGKIRLNAIPVRKNQNDHSCLKERDSRVSSPRPTHLKNMFRPLKSTRCWLYQIKAFSLKPHLQQQILFAKFHCDNFFFALIFIDKYTCWKTGMPTFESNQYTCQRKFVCVNEPWTVYRQKIQNI
jgi:hypothetical protein